MPLHLGPDDSDARTPAPRFIAVNRPRPAAYVEPERTVPATFVDILDRHLTVRTTERLTVDSVHTFRVFAGATSGSLTASARVVDVERAVEEYAASYEIGLELSRPLSERDLGRLRGVAVLSPEPDPRD
jgi:hypothetical protein